MAVVLTLTLAASAVVGTSVWELVTFPLTTMPHPAMDLSTTPASWVPVAFGDAQVSVPPTWAVMTHTWCGGTSQLIVQLGVVKQDMDCPAAPSPATVRIIPLGTIPAPYGQEQSVRLNGISVLLGPEDATSISYFVPPLHVEVWATDGPGARVIDTLAAAPRAVVLAPGSAAAVPSSWQSVSFARLHFSVPANWPITRTQMTPGLGVPTSLPSSQCRLGGTASGRAVWCA